MTDILWKLDQITQTGRGKQCRLDRVCAEIPRGITAVIGPSGAGKTSLLNLLAGFEHPAGGTLTAHLPASGDRLPLFWVPPDDGLWPHLTVGEHLQAVSPHSAGPDGTPADLLAEFDLQDKIEARPDQLSQGERARLAVTRALASRAAVLVMDEPLTHIDSRRGGRYWQVLRDRLKHQGETSVVFSTHSAETALREADWALCLGDGKLLFSGPIDELYSNPATPDLAWTLGPANWFESPEQTDWLNGGAVPRHCYRPEQIRLEVASQSHLVVKSSAFCGSVAEVDLVNEHTGNSRRFYHRPCGDTLQPGDRVVIQLCLLLVCVLALVGCSVSAADRPLPVDNVEYWSVPAEGSRIPAPRAVHATAKGEVYVLDNVGRVLVFADSGTLLRQWWMPEYSVGRPEKIRLLKDGRLAVADTHYHRVVFFDEEGALAGTLGSYGREQEQFIYPVAIAQDDEENLYVCEYGGNDRIQKFTKEGKYLLQFGGFGTGRGEFQRPSGIAWHDHRLFVVDAFNNRIQVFSEQGELVEILGSGAADEALYYPYDIAVSPAGEIYVVEYGGGRVSRLDLQGRLTGRFGSTGAGENQFNTPWGMCLDSRGCVYVADTGNRRIVRLHL